MKIIALLMLAIFAFASSVMAAKNPICDLPMAISDDNVRVCRMYSEAWAYNSETNECVYFINGGCGIGGNDNQFNSLAACEQTCKH